MASCPPSPIPVRGHGCTFPSPGLCVEPGAANWGGTGDEDTAQLRGTGLSTQFAGTWTQVPAGRVTLLEVTRPCVKRSFLGGVTRSNLSPAVSLLGLGCFGEEGARVGARGGFGGAPLSWQLYPGRGKAFLQQDFFFL